MSLLTDVLKFIRANPSMAHLVIADTLEEAHILKGRLSDFGIKAAIVSMRQPVGPYVSLTDGVGQLESRKIDALIGMRQLMVQGYRVSEIGDRRFAYSSTITLSDMDIKQFLGRAGTSGEDSKRRIRSRPKVTVAAPTVKPAKKKASKAFAKLVEHLRKQRDSIVVKKEVLVPRWSHTYGNQEPGSETIEYVDFDKLCSAIDHFSDQLRKQK